MTGGRVPGAPLVWNVSGLLAEDPGATRDYRVAGVTIDLGEDLQLADPIEGTVRLARTNRGLFVSASFTTALAAECSRCLREIEIPVEIAIEQEVLPAVDLHSGQPIRLRTGEAEDEILRLTDHHELDLEQAVREAIQLEEPIAPLCEPDCRGLCLTCGERLDAGVHEHADDEIDPRLEALRAFQVDAERENG